MPTTRSQQEATKSHLTTADSSRTHSKIVPRFVPSAKAIVSKDLDEERTTSAKTGSSITPSCQARALPAKLTVGTTKLSSKDHALLLRKQFWLKSHKIGLPESTTAVHDAVKASLVFAQKEAGTAVCVSPRGLLLTCSHCVAEDVAGYNASKSHWLLFASGLVVETKCVAWDPKRDIALLQIIAAQSFCEDAPKTAKASSSAMLQQHTGPLPYVQLATSPPQLNKGLCCVGHPGSEDLEADRPGVKTNYDVLHVSTGAFRGYALGQDLQDNSEIGALMHDCWTYWGHSGAPILDSTSGRLIGLHSSWDEQSGMRRGIPLEAIAEFMNEHRQMFAAP